MSERCIDGRMFRHTPFPDDPELESDVGRARTGRAAAAMTICPNRAMASAVRTNLSNPIRICPSSTTACRSEGHLVRRRILVVLVLPLSIAAAVAGRLARELRLACTLVRLDVQHEIAAAKRRWKGDRRDRELREERGNG
jgi:hypothetical protein